MTEDLRRALDDLAARTTAEHHARGGLPVTEMTDRARRARTRRAALVSGAVAAALVVVAGTGYAVTRWDRGAEPLPADTPPVTPAPSPTGAAPALVLPTGDPDLPFGECGSLVGAATVPAADPTAGITVTASPSVLGGQEIEISTALVPPQGARRGFERASGPRAVLAHDGVVVAVVDVPLRTEEADSFLEASSVSLASTITTRVTHTVPVVCEDAAGTGTPEAALPAGEYQVLAVGEVWWSDTDPEVTGWPLDLSVTDLAAATGATHAVAVGGPAALTIAAEQVDPASVPAAPTGTPTAPSGAGAAFNVCAPPDLGSAIAGFTTGGSGDPVRVGADDAIPFAMTLAYEGPGRARWQSLAPSLALVRDGVLVAVVEGIDGGVVDGDHGTVQPLASEGSSALRCQDGWAVDSVTLEAGTYQAIPWTTVWVDRLTASDGTEVTVPSGPDDLGHQVTGTPFTLVVE